ncbi:hypothetical protein [Actinomadura monticuli]|uniref:Uncharacterized protein n=1 Tax=Actinomadura monticuli TaxID=3097367 RepID=A0ABV4QAE3_9ACTN
METEIIVGMIGAAATVSGAVIQRSWHWRGGRVPHGGEATEFGRFREDASFSVDEVVKVLDLRRSPGDPGVTVLTDTYLVRRTAEKGNGLVSFYGTSGTLEARCVSHPGAGHEFGPIESRHMPVNCAMGVDLRGLAMDAVVRVINEVTFTGAYDRVPVENFETHIDRPTRALVFVVLLPERHPAVDITGFMQTGRRTEKKADRENGPILVGGGTVAHWRITPEKGRWLPAEARYRVEWHWRPAPGGGHELHRAAAEDGT